MGLLSEVLLVSFTFHISNCYAQKIPFDEHYYNNQRSQSGSNPYFTNSSFSTNGNITEFYAPDVYSQGVPRRGTGNALNYDQFKNSDISGSNPNLSRTGTDASSRPQNPQVYDERNRIYDTNRPAQGDQSSGYPSNTWQQSEVRGPDSGTYQNQNPPPSTLDNYPPNPNIPNYNDPYSKSILNYTDYNNQRRPDEEIRRTPFEESGRRQFQSDGRNPNFNYPTNTGNSPWSDNRNTGNIHERSNDQFQRQPNSNYPGSQYSDTSGSRQQWNYPGRQPFDPGDPHRNIWNEPWSTTTNRPIAPGILGSWRPELQGKRRQDDYHKLPDSVFVTTAYGRVQGFKVKLYDGPGVPLPIRPGITQVDRTQATVSCFVGIPYAKPPVNEGRFRPPRPHQGWQIHQAIEFGPACPQPARFFGYTAGIVQVSEDCLYLNIYSPDVASGVEGAPFPVLFYIHDGDFIHGGSQTFPPHQLVAWHRVIVVTVNFRIGALGFLSTADEFSPGNYGMLDLALALKWVHSTIRSFNGDPDRITLLGLGSGAAAAGLLMLSPKSRSYVRNVVALEGAPTADWAAINDRYRLQNTTQLFSLKLGCWNQYDTTSWSMVQCLRSRSWQELANLELDPDVGVFPWSPVVDRTFKVPINSPEPEWSEENWRFLQDTPEKLLRQGDYPYVKYMTGSSRQAAGDLLYENKTLAPNFVVTREWFDQMIHLWVKKYNYTLNPEGVYSAIRYSYTYWPDPMNTTHLRDEYIQFLSDALYRSPIDQTVKLLLARGIQVHSYLLNYTLEGLRLPEWRDTTRTLEYYLLIGAPFMDSEFIPERLRQDRSTWTEGDRNMSEFFMGSVANMAHYGSPTPREILGIYWERATPADLKYLVLNGTNNSTMQRNYRQRELTFWTEYMPFVVGRYVPTYPPTTEYWWEPNEPLQIAFWSVSGICLLLIVALVACCLLWRTAKKQRDRVYHDYGPGNRSLDSGPIIGGDEITSEYAASVKTADSLDSGVKLSHHPNPPRGGPPISIHPPENHPLFESHQIHTNRGAISQATLSSRDRYPIPKRALRTPDSSQTQV